MSEKGRRPDTHPLVGIGERIDKIARYVGYLECALLTSVSEKNGCGKLRRMKCAGRWMGNPDCACAVEAAKYLPKEFR